MAATEYRRLTFIVWACITVAMAAILGQRAWEGWTADTDDAMRLVQVADLLGGQPWNDLTQYRLNPPDGTPMHWARLPDAPIALIAFALSSLVPVHQGLTVAAMVLPPIYFMLFLLPFAASARLLLGGARAPVALLVGMCGSVSLAQFIPGRVDHHGLQLVMLTSASTLLLMGLGRSRWRHTITWAGVPFGLSIWIGIEMLPLTAAWFAALGLIWCRAGGDIAKYGARAALLAALIGLAALLTSTPPMHWLTPYCDALSPVLIAAMALVAAGFGIMHQLTERTHSIAPRLAIAALCGGLTATIFLFSFPACVSGDSLALDPLVQQQWLDRVSEAQSVWPQFPAAPFTAIGKLWAPVLGLGYCLWHIVRTRSRARDLWIALAIVLLCPTLLTFWQVRNANFAQLVALLPLAGLAADAWRKVRGQRARWLQLATLLPILFICSIAFWPTIGWGYESIARALGADDAAVDETSKVECRNYLPITVLPDQPALILSYIDIGPMLLFSTPHSVVGAPYHRDNIGLKTTIELFRSSDDEVIRGRLRSLGIDWVVTCPGIEERSVYRTTAGDGLAERLAANKVPDYLEPVSDPKQPALQFYRVRAP